MIPPNLEQKLTGLLLGTAVGDALGLPAEGMSRDRIRRHWRGDWRMRLVLGRGMVSDDTDHAFLVGQALLASVADAVKFRRELAARLRWWFLALPAGVGLATARACLKLWVGISPERSGVYSAGNGPAMRSALIGAVFANDEARRKEYVRASTLVTHTDTRAETAALAVAEAAAWSVRAEPTPGEFLPRLLMCGSDKEWNLICHQIAAAVQSGQSVRDFADALGLERGVTGYAYHTVPVAIYAWLRHPREYRTALVQALECGGDTDTVGAIAGALVGCNAGVAEIPTEWVDKLWMWPRRIETLNQLARRLGQAQHEERPQPPVNYFWPGMVLRNAFFLGIVLAHGLRRLLPPY